MLISSALHVLLGIFIILYEFIRKRKAYIDFLFFFNLWFFLSFVLSPLFIINGGSNYSHPSFYYETSLNQSIVAFIIIIAYFVIILGYNITIQQKGLNRLLVVRSTLDKKTAYKLWLLLFAIGIIAMYIFIKQYGGLSIVLENANTIRSGKTERDNLGAISSTFIKLTYFSYWILFTYIVISKYRNITINKTLYSVLLISLILSITFSIISGGRGGMINVLLVSYFILIFINKKLYLRYLIPLLPLMSFILLFGKVISSNLDYGIIDIISLIRDESMNLNLFEIIRTLTQNFAHPYLSLQLAIDKVDLHELRWFLDIPYSFIFYLQLFGLETPATITYYNTLFAIGRFESNIPPGIIGFFWYSLAFPGVILGGLIYGFIGRVLNDFLYELTNTPIGIVIYITVGQMYGNFVFNGDLRVTILQYFAFSIMTFIYLAFYNKYSVKVQFNKGHVY